MAAPILSVENLRTSFVARRGSVVAVDDVSFSVAAGETLALVGESGCGKSTTALSIMRLLDTESTTVEGVVRFGDKDVLALSMTEFRRIRGKSMAMVFQDPMTSLNPVLTIGRQITETLEAHMRLHGARARERAVALLAMVGIPDPANRLNDYPHQFSGGMRQRVMIAIALSCTPRLLLADEITTALDVTVQAQVLELLKRLSAETGTATLLITHDLGVVAGMADRVNVMYAGQIVESAPTAALFSASSMPYTWGLMASVPRMDTRRESRLVPIKGLPPDLANPPKGCRFEPRCTYRRAICAEKAPPLNPRPGQNHLARCWGTQPGAEGGWLIGKDVGIGRPAQMETVL